MRLAAPDLSKDSGRKRAALVHMVCGNFVTVIVIIQGLVLIPLYFKYIGLELYGVWLATGGVLAGVSLVNFGVDPLVMQKMSRAYGSRRFKAIAKYYSNGIFISIFICGFAILLGLVFSNYLHFLFDLNSTNQQLIKSCFQIAVIALGVDILSQSISGLSRSLLRPLFSSVLRAISRLLGFFLIWFLLTLGFGLWAAAFGLLFVSTFNFLGNFFYSFYLYTGLHQRVIFSWVIIRSYLKISPMLYCSRLSNIVSVKTEPLMIALLISPEMTAIYTVMIRAIEIVVRLLANVRSALFPSIANFFGIINEASDKSLKYQPFNIIVLLSLVGASCYLFLNEQFITLWIGLDEIAQYDYVVLLLGIAYFFYLLNRAQVVYLHAFGDFSRSSVSVLLENILRMVLTLIFLKIYGLVGVPLSILISSLAFSLNYARMLSSYDFRIIHSLNGKEWIGILLIFVISIYGSMIHFEKQSWEVFIFVSLLISTGLFALGLIFFDDSRKFVVDQFSKYCKYGF